MVRHGNRLPWSGYHPWKCLDRDGFGVMVAVMDTELDSTIKESEYPKLEGTHREHWVWFLTGRSRNPSTYQSSGALSVWCHHHCTKEPVPVLHHTGVKKLSLISKTNLPWLSSSHFLKSCHTRDGSEPAPPLPITRILRTTTRCDLSLIISKLNKWNDLTHSP